jgi:hypothetical protein
MLDKNKLFRGGALFNLIGELKHNPVKERNIGESVN